MYVYSDLFTFFYLSLPLSPLTHTHTHSLTLTQENVIWELSTDEDELTIYQNLICPKASQAVSKIKFI